MAQITILERLRHDDRNPTQDPRAAPAAGMDRSSAGLRAHRAGRSGPNYRIGNGVRRALAPVPWGVVPSARSPHHDRDRSSLGRGAGQPGRARAHGRRLGPPPERAEVEDTGDAGIGPPGGAGPAGSSNGQTGAAALGCDHPSRQCHGAAGRAHRNRAARRRDGSPGQLDGSPPTPEARVGHCGFRVSGDSLRSPGRELRCRPALSRPSALQRNPAASGRTT